MEFELRGTGKKFGKSVALDGVSLRLGPGLTCLIGSNGAGKTTLLHCLAGLARPTAGSIEVDGRELMASDPGFRRRMALLPDFPFAYAHHSIFQHVALWVRSYGIEVDGTLEASILDWLEDFDLLDIAEHPIGVLSRGQQYKATMVAQLAVAPELWILDEPFASGMDPRGLAAFRRGAEQRIAAGATVVYSTQILEVAERFADRVVVLEKGRVSHDLDGEGLRALAEKGSGNLAWMFTSGSGEEA